MIEQFSLDKWLKDKSHKVVTRDGKPVRIICWDKKDSEYPIVGLVSNENGLKEKEGCCSFTIDGKAWGESYYDLFFADEEEELTEFEGGLFSLVSEFWQKYDLLEEEVDIAELVKENSKELLDLARKEIEKDLPKWKKAIEHIDMGRHVAIIEDDRVILSDYVEEDEYYIVLDDFKTLPKEE